MRYPSHLLRLLLALVLIAAAGCSSSNPDAPPLRDGQHPANWLQAHGASYLKNSGRCTPCHGDPRDPSSTGGIAQVSCSKSFNGVTCHPGGPFGHLSGFAAPSVHGADYAKKQPDLTKAQGFDYCSKCHGETFGGLSALGSPACGSCHGIPAPHPQSWVGSDFTHITTQVDNAVVCARCHLNGQNSPLPTPSPAPAGTSPGCFNNTLCHGAVAAGHPSGWEDPSQHGAAAKAAPADMNGFMNCRGCHGSDFRGSGSAPSCFQCHTSTPHAPPPWSGTPYTHTTTDTGNAPACDICHHNSSAPAGTSPGCFNNTLCHGSQQASHPLPTWLEHNSASNIPSGCTPCHGSELQGASGPACTTCHFNLSNLTASPPVRDCTSCHSAPPSGSSFPNIAGAHPAHLGLPTTLTCNTCHDGYGSGTQIHYDNSRNKLDHPGSVALDTSWNDLAGASSFNASAFTCANVRCHGGKTTPNWRTGSIDVTSDCTACHSSSGSYISWSGGAESHHTGKADCTDCHNISVLNTIHFTHLETTAFDTPPGNTISGPRINSYDPATKSCSPKCHGTERWK